MLQNLESGRIDLTHLAIGFVSLFLAARLRSEDHQRWARPGSSVGHLELADADRLHATSLADPAEPVHGDLRMRIVVHRSAT